MKKFNIENWNRKSQYEFFKDYEDPFFNISFNLDITNLKQTCKEKERSVLLALYYFSLKAAHEIPEFKLRFYQNELVEVNNMVMGSTVLNDDKSFSYIYFPMEDSWESFELESKKLLEYHRSKPDFKDKEYNMAVIHGSVLPWIAFTAIKHARRGDEKDKGIPKFVYGKIFDQSQKIYIPMSVEVHHALMDGWHVAQFIDKLLNYLNSI